MKITGAFLMMVLLLASCGGKKTETAVAEDSVADSAFAETFEPAEDANTFFITKDGIGPVRIGDEINELPAQIPGLYTEMIHSETDQAQEYVFSTSEAVTFTALDYLEGKIDLIFVGSPSIKVRSEKGNFGLGDSFDSVLSLPGVETEWYSRDDNGHGIWYWVWNGLWFTVNQERLTPTLQDKLYTNENPPVAADFDKDVKIGYIGTGAPF